MTTTHLAVLGKRSQIISCLYQLSMVLTLLLNFMYLCNCL